MRWKLKDFKIYDTVPVTIHGLPAPDVTAAQENVATYHYSTVAEYYSTVTVTYSTVTVTYYSTVTVGWLSVPLPLIGFHYRYR